MHGWMTNTEKWLCVTANDIQLLQQGHRVLVNYALNEMEVSWQTDGVREGLKDLRGSS